ncbi:hypothetical protein DFH09DRAFT_1467726 [Mycena vulgaris]|nr:hypothetical protein DFH09DRAFT_1467726 [Mycena vulgaris]
MRKMVNLNTRCELKSQWMQVNQDTSEVHFMSTFRLYTPFLHNPVSTNSISQKTPKQFILTEICRNGRFTSFREVGAAEAVIDYAVVSQTLLSMVQSLGIALADDLNEAWSDHVSLTLKIGGAILDMAPKPPRKAPEQDDLAFICSFVLNEVTRKKKTREREYRATTVGPRAWRTRACLTDAPRTPSRLVPRIRDSRPRATILASNARTSLNPTRARALAAPAPCTSQLVPAPLISPERSAQGRGRAVPRGRDSRLVAGGNYTRVWKGGRLTSFSGSSKGGCWMSAAKVRGSSDKNEGLASRTLREERWPECVGADAARRDHVERTRGALLAVRALESIAALRSSSSSDLHANVVWRGFCLCASASKRAPENYAQNEDDVERTSGLMASHWARRDHLSSHFGLTTSDLQLESPSLAVCRASQSTPRTSRGLARDLQASSPPDSMLCASVSISTHRLETDLSLYAPGARLSTPRQVSGRRDGVQSHISLEHTLPSPQATKSIRE